MLCFDGWLERWISGHPPVATHQWPPAGHPAHLPPSFPVPTPSSGILSKVLLFPIFSFDNRKEMDAVVFMAACQERQNIVNIIIIIATPVKYFPGKLYFLFLISVVRRAKSSPFSPLLPSNLRLPNPGQPLPPLLHERPDTCDGPERLSHRRRRHSGPIQIQERIGPERRTSISRYLINHSGALILIEWGEVMWVGGWWMDWVGT